MAQAAALEHRSRDRHPLDAIGIQQCVTPADEFRQIDVHETQLVLVDGAERILQTYHPDQAPRAARYLKPFVALLP